MQIVIGPIMCLAFVLRAYNPLTIFQISCKDMRDVRCQFPSLFHIAYTLIAQHKIGRDLRKLHLPHRFLYDQRIGLDTVQLLA